ncbi:substrate-binding periplasmic protein [Aeromonas sp. 102P]|uniref:substrate-binding periplasmic protein n=1 Tax=Aeromonas sp. 102P TaxID=3452711 RepID=UPI003F794413
MLRICLLLCCLCTVVNCRADSIEVYCDDWPGFCQQDGKGIYLDLVRAIYQPHGYQVTPHIVPYKRALAVIAKKGGDMAMGVYRDEVTGVRQPRYPASADDLTVFMLKKWQLQWQGEKSLEGQKVIWRRGWAFDKYIHVTMQWHEIDSDEMALQLLDKERYRYYLTAGVLYASEVPSNLHRTFLRWIRTYPIFADTPQGNRMLQLWDKGMIELIRSGDLAEIYKRYQLYDYYQGFIKELEQKVAASPAAG